MQPVVGVDVSKGSSEAQAFRKKDEPYGKPVKIMHEKSGFERFSVMLDTLQAETGLAPVVILEATGHYHRALVRTWNEVATPTIW